MRHRQNTTLFDTGTAVRACFTHPVKVAPRPLALERLLRQHVLRIDQLGVENNHLAVSRMDGDSESMSARSAWYDESDGEADATADDGTADESSESNGASRDGSDGEAEATDDDGTADESLECNGGADESDGEADATADDGVAN